MNRLRGMSNRTRVLLIAAVASTVALLVQLGVPVTPEQQAAILTCVASWTALAATHSVSQSIRKPGAQDGSVSAVAPPGGSASVEVTAPPADTP